MINYKFKYKLGDIIKTSNNIVGTIMFYYVHKCDNEVSYGYTVKVDTCSHSTHDGYPYAYTSSGKQVPPDMYDNLFWVLEGNIKLIKSRKDFIYKLLL